jgi:hypothetical protein
MDKGTVRANAFFRIDFFLNNRGTVRAFDFFSLKTENFRQKEYGTPCA